jgi:hypothetical protein
MLIRRPTLQRRSAAAPTAPTSPGPPSLYCALAVAPGGYATAAAPGQPFHAAVLPPRPRNLVNAIREDARGEGRPGSGTPGKTDSRGEGRPGSGTPGPRGAGRPGSGTPGERDARAPGSGTPGERNDPPLRANDPLPAAPRLICRRRALPTAGCTASRAGRRRPPDCRAAAARRSWQPRAVPQRIALRRRPNPKNSAEHFRRTRM